MAKKSAAARAQKKHEKANKRKKKLEKRRNEPSALDRWKPLTEGVEGLARRTRIRMYAAFEFAEHLKTHWPQTQDLWTIARADATTTDELLIGLEAHGIGTDAKTFAERGLVTESAFVIADEWIAAFDSPKSPHERDFVRAAASVLWLRWLTGLLPNEEVEYVIEQAEVSTDSAEPWAAIESLADLWAELGEDAAGRLHRLDLGVRYTDALVQACQEDTGETEFDLLERAVDILDVVVPLYAPETGANIKFRAELDDLADDALEDDEPNEAP